MFEGDEKHLERIEEFINYWETSFDDTDEFDFEEIDRFNAKWQQLTEVDYLTIIDWSSHQELVKIAKLALA